MNYGATVTYQTDTHSLTFSADGAFWLTETPDFSSLELALDEVQSPGQHGAALCGWQALPKSITFTGSIVREVEKNRATLLQVVQPGVPARIVYRHGGQCWVLQGCPARTPYIESGVCLQNFQFVFRASYPFWQSEHESCTVIAGLQGLFQFPLTLSGVFYLSRYSQNFYQNVPLAGNMPCGFTAEMRMLAEVKEPELYHVNARQYVRFTGTYAAGDVLRVCTVPGKRTVQLLHADGREENAFARLASGSSLGLQLAPGTNTLRFTAASGRENVHCTLTAPSAFASGV